MHNLSTITATAMLACSRRFSHNNDCLLRAGLIHVRNLAVTGRHSKNVAAKKNKLDAERTKLYTRLGYKITIAAKASGADPGSNVDLARALKEAYGLKLPKENIDRALKKATDQSTDSYESGVYEVFGHGGVGLLVTTLSDNSNRAIKAVKEWSRKSEVKMASTGSVLFKFQQHAVFSAQSSYDKDTVIEKVIELGLDEVDFLDAKLLSESAEYDSIIAPSSQLGLLQDVASSLGIVGSANLTYLPVERVAVSAESADKNWEVIDAFEALDDVDAVYHDMQTSS